MKYITIDLETSGLDPEKHQILELVAVVDNFSRDKIDSTSVFHEYIKPLQFEIDTQICSLSEADRLTERGRNPDWVFQRFEQFIQDQFQDDDGCPESIISVTIPEVIQFINNAKVKYLPNDMAIWRLIESQRLDLRSLYFNPQLNTNLPGLDDILEVNVEENITPLTLVCSIIGSIRTYYKIKPVKLSGN